MRLCKYLCLLLLVQFAACTSAGHFSKEIIQPVLEHKETDPVLREVDEIFSLLTYALVFRDWQYDSVPREKRRGYNIGALLVNSQQEPVYYGLNCINSTENATQHGEVRSITGYLEKTRRFNLEGFTMYTSLEPCVMCAGMITMTSVKRVVYGQHDVEYSRAFERLAIDTRPIGGFAPYPRTVLAHACTLKFCAQLDSAYQAFFEKEKKKMLARFLTSAVAYDIFKAASEEFLQYQPKHPENKEIYEKSVVFFKLQLHP